MIKKLPPRPQSKLRPKPPRKKRKPRNKRLSKREQQRRGTGKGGEAGTAGTPVVPPAGTAKGKTGPGGKAGPMTPVTPVKPEEVEPNHPDVQMVPNVRVEVVNLAVITGLIPYKKLVEEYRQTLIESKTQPESGKNSAANTEPIVTNVFVERAEVTGPDQPVEQLQWADLTTAVDGCAESKRRIF